MALSKTRKLGIQETGLRYKILIIEALVFVIPSLVIFFIIHTSNFLLKPSHLFLVAMTMALVLSGLIILRQIINKFFTMATLLKRVESGEKFYTDLQSETVELKEITASFNSVMKKLDETTSDLKCRVFELFAIKELTEAASKSLDIDKLLNILLEKSLSVSNAQIGSVLMVESEKKRFRVVTSKGLGARPEKNSYISINESLLGDVVTNKKPLLVKDIEIDPRTSRPNDPKYGSPSFLSTPILVRENLLAVMNLAHKDTEQVFDSDDQEILSIMIGEIGFALENAMLHSRVEEHLKELQRHTVALTNANDQLQQEITDRKQAEDKIKVSLKEKEVLLQEIHHRVKNNMQIISSLLKLQAAGAGDEQVTDALMGFQGRVQAMALVHETLYGTDTLAVIDFKTYIFKIANQTFQTYKTSMDRVKLEVDTKGIKLGIEQTTPLGLIANELVTNALKYAFPENQSGEIVISIRAVEKDSIEFVFSDNGIGIPEGLDWRNTDSLGLRLVIILAENQLDGTVSLDRENGTHFTIKFRHKENK